MKRTYLVLGAVLCGTILSATASAQTTYTWTPGIVSPTDWQVPTNWMPTRLIPNPSDIIVIDGGTTPAPTIENVASESIGELLVVNGAFATISASGATTLTIGGGAAANDFEIDALSVLIVSGSNAITITLSTGATGSVSGQMFVTGGAHRLTAANASAITFQNGSLFSASAGFTGNAFGMTNNSSIVFANGSTYGSFAGSNPFGALAPGTAVVFQTGSLYSHAQTGAPSLSNRTYANFEVSGPMTGVTVNISTPFGGPWTVDRVEIKAGNQLNWTHAAGSGTATLNIRGNLIVDGQLSFANNDSQDYSIRFNGSAPQTIAGNGTIVLPASLAGVFTDNTTGVTLQRDLSVSSALTILGTLDQGASFSLTTGTISIASGGLLRNLGTGDLTLGGDITNDGTVNLNGGGVTCGDADGILIRSSVAATQRTWSGTGVFDFTDVDVQDQAGAIPLTAVHSTDSGNNINWTFQSACGPSIARLDTFVATRYANGRVRLDWKTGFEVDNLGFHVYRDQAGERTRVTPQLVAGSALLAGPGVRVMAGHSYSWLDDRASGESTYWLEDVSLDGNSVWHGPAAVRDETDRLPSSHKRSPLLAELTTDATQADGTAPPARAIKPAKVTEASLEVHAKLSSKPALKISIDREGLYRITKEELIGAGFDPQADPRMLRLIVEGREQPIAVVGDEAGRFDAIEFYGMGVDAAHTGARVYWLVDGSQPGRRIQPAKGKGSRPAALSFPYTVERRDRSVYFSSLRNGDTENFFGAVVAGAGIDQTVTVGALDSSSASGAQLEVALQGVSLFGHRVKIAVNDVEVGEVSFAEQDSGVSKLMVPTGVLVEGANRIRLIPQGGPTDVSLVDYIRLTYPRLFEAENNALRFTLAANQRATVGGFTTSAIRVFDITDETDVREVAAMVSGGEGNYLVSVSAPKPGKRTLFALAADKLGKPAAISLNRASSLRSSRNQADLVIITRPEFFESVKPLQTLRQSQGLAVVVVDIEDIYDEFSHGLKSPHAIRDFLSATRKWQQAPRFGLLVGDSSLDPRNHLGQGDLDLVPTRLLDTDYLETASDDWFADFDLDGLADIALGRLPVRNAETADRIIAKITEADAAKLADRVVIVSDSNDESNFESHSEGLAGLVPDGVEVDEIYRGRMAAEIARTRLIESLGRGARIVNYFGHGNVAQWRGGLLTNLDSDGLARTEGLSLILSITCLNGYFQDVVQDSLAESLLDTDRGGAVVVWASSGLCNVSPQAALNQAMFKMVLAGDGGLTIGEAARLAKKAVDDTDVRLTYILFGDPSAPIR